MRKQSLLAVVALSFLAQGCGKAAALPPVVAAVATPPATAPVAPVTSAPDLPTGNEEPASTNGPWIGVSAEGGVLAATTRETFLGIWVDAPKRKVRPERRGPIELALVVDTSGSMGGSKIVAAREAASTLVRSLRDGDIVALDAFSDEAQTIVPPTVVSAGTREAILGEIRRLVPSGSTNIFAGLTLAQNQIAAAPATHAIRRIVVLSDGQANRGPSSPEMLGSIARQGLRIGAQVTSLGVGIDYDERTLNEMAVQTNGRLHHVVEPQETAGVLASELALVDSTLANDAFVEIVAAPGVEILRAEGLPGDRFAGGLRIPLGALHAGQHREALVRVRIVDPATFSAQQRPLASVRLRFRDAEEGNLERIQEVIARAQLSTDARAVAASQDARTQGMIAMRQSAEAQLAAAQRVNDGNFEQAEKELERARQALLAQASTMTNATEKRRLEAAASKVETARVATRAMPAQPKAAQRAGALKMNAAAMADMGY